MMPLALDPSRAGRDFCEEWTNLNVLRESKNRNLYLLTERYTAFSDPFLGRNASGAIPEDFYEPLTAIHAHPARNSRPPIGVIAPKGFIPVSARA